MNFAEFILWAIPTGTPVFVIVSIVLYIKNRIEAKKDGREIDKIYEKLFTVSLAIIILFAVSVLFGILYARNSPAVQESQSSSDAQVADSVHTALLTAMYDPEIQKKEEFAEDLNALTKEFDITQCDVNENCILAGAARILNMEDFHELSKMLRSRGVTGRILVTVYETDRVQVVVEGSKYGEGGEEITIR